MVGGENVYVRGFGSFVVKKRAKKQHVIFQKTLRLLSLSILFQALNQQKYLLKK